MKKQEERIEELEREVAHLRDIQAKMLHALQLLTDGNKMIAMFMNRTNQRCTQIEKHFLSDVSSGVYRTSWKGGN